eukprot:TRINITY_DN7136_c0_g1_i1.p1 TRINITY_DN7136_c0_g1~~TRINITY_DN7136_c0_g1_i1.p1  ORF type:complete len:159 (+),score=9.38 TRINITY_DN7136_c0_g1_i1:129-605(+)
MRVLSLELIQSMAVLSQLGSGSFEGTPPKLTSDDNNRLLIEATDAVIANKSFVNLVATVSMLQKQNYDLLNNLTVLQNHVERLAKRVNILPLSSTWPARISLLATRSGWFDASHGTGWSDHNRNLLDCLWNQHGRISSQTLGRPRLSSSPAQIALCWV